TINTVINGSAGLAKTGFGTLRLLPTSSNAFSGPISITGLNSTLYVRSNVALGNTANDIDINAGRLQLDGVTNPTFLVTGRTITPGASGGTVELMNNAFLDLNTALGANANAMTFTGQGTVELNTPSARTGSTFVSGVLLRINSATAMGNPGTASLTNGAVLEVNNGSGTFAGSVTFGAGTVLRGGAGTHTFGGVANVGGNMAINGGLSGSDTLILGADAVRLGSGWTTTVNVGTVRLDAANSYAGGWTIAGGALQIGDPGAMGTGSGAVVVSGSGRLKVNAPSLARDITLNNPGGGVELLQSTTIAGDITVPSTSAYVPIIGPGFELTLTGDGSTFAYGGTAFFGGASGVGSLRVQGGADLSGASARLYGTGAAPTHIAVSGAGSTWVNTGEVWIGNSLAGGATLLIEAGGSLSCPGVYIGVGEDGSATVTGEGSTLTSASLLKVGLASQSTMSLLAGADVTALDTFVGEGISASGTLTINGAGSTWTNQGLLIVGKAASSGGTPAEGVVNLSNGGTLTCLGMHLGDGASASSTLTISGGLTRLDCGAAGILMCQNGAASTLNLNGGLIDIDGNIDDAGTGVSTLIMSGATLDMHNHAIGGANPIDILEFRSGTLKNVSEINNGAGLTKTGPGTLYLNTSNSYTGTTTVSEGTLFVVNLLTGSATGAGPILVAPGATIAGPGYVAGPLNSNGGVAPAGFIGSPFGTLTVENNYNQALGGTLHIEVGGTSQFDRVVLTNGTAALDGTLHVTLLNGFVPAAGDAFDILSASSVSGTFSDSNLPALPPGLSWDVQYLANALRLSVTGAGGCDSTDFNNDGLFPDTADIDDFLSVFSGGPCSNDPNCGEVDFNNDGLFPDTLDIDSLLSVFSGGPCL
ncbi:MAG TPA: autotransporter-associated beta strand repeat-containing protein, partial [Phycisphaerales bacterium]|nr:autotransporter-associated beta strand repeat-containing protein [Phycisphaerales bacterium]